MKTPLLFIIFNRPEQTKRVFEEIRKAKPVQLFIAADGPRYSRPEDIQKCRETRDAVSNIDWPCEVKTLFREKNLGCKMGATTAIDWFFENVEEGIILEDDCLPHPSFFTFCEVMLEHFRDDTRIAMIDGYNIAGTSDIPESYLFSRYGHLWGWASWRRVWNEYDVTMKVWESEKNRKLIKAAMNDKYQWNYRQWLYHETYMGRKDTWDYQWESYRLLHNQLSVIPKVNMIENIGFGPEATHTTQAHSYLMIEGKEMQFPLTHNTNITPDDSYDALLRPKVPARPMYIRIMKEHIKKISKKILPPVVYDLTRRVVKHRKAYTPAWHTLSYKPLNGIKLYFDSSGSFQRKMLEGSYDTYLFERLKNIDTRGKVFFDIGAHIGYHSYYFARLAGKNGKVHAFEPSKPNVDRIRMILDNNKDISPQIQVHNVAVSDAVSTETFNINNDIESGRSSGNFIESADPFWTREEYSQKGFAKTEVKTVPIDQFKKELGINDTPDIIKIDVEGAEHLVLLGAKELLTSKKPLLYIEIHSIVNMYNVVSLLHSLSYETTVLKTESNGTCFLEARPKK